MSRREAARGRRSAHRAGVFLAALLLGWGVTVGCPGKTERWTGLRLEVDLREAPPVDQLLLSVSLDGSPLVDGARRPEVSGDPLGPERESLIIRFDDARAGRLARVQVRGLREGAVVATGEATQLLERGRLVPMRVALSAVARCGDGQVDAAEQCDDGGLTPGDGCDGDCQVEPGWQCSGGPSRCQPLPACQGDEECPGSLCDVLAGHCVAAHHLVHVDCNSACPGDGTQAAPRCSLAEALSGAEPGQTFWVHGSTCTGPFEARVSGVQIVGEAGAVLTAPTCPVLRVVGATVAVRGVTVSPQGGVGGGVAAAEGAGLVLSWSRVAGGQCVGIDCVDSECRVWWTEVRGCKEGGVRILRSDFEVVGNLIVGNGTNQSAFGGMYVDAGGASPARLAFNTVVDNRASGGAAGCGGLCCLTEARVSESILWENSGDEVQGACAVADSVVQQASLDGVGGCVFADPLLDASYHLLPGSPAIDRVPPGTGDVPQVDLDGRTRPLGQGADWGAFEYDPSSGQ